MCAVVSEPVLEDGEVKIGVGRFFTKFVHALVQIATKAAQATPKKSSPLMLVHGPSLFTSL